MISIRRSLKELVALYALEPSLKDIFVEGQSDKSLIQWYFNEMGRSDVRVFMINTVEVPNELLAVSRLSTHSERNRVIVLSEYLSTEIKAMNPKVRCIADKDFNHYLGIQRRNRLLFYTDYNSMDMYLFNEKTLRKCLSFYSQTFPISPKKLICSLKKILQRIFLLRLANEGLGWGMTRVDLKKYIKWESKKITFDEAKYIQAYLQRNNRLRQRKSFEAKVVELSGKLGSDPRQNIRGHDFIYVLYLLLKRFFRRSIRLQNFDTFRGVILGLLEIVDVQKENLFQKLNSI